MALSEFRKICIIFVLAVSNQPVVLRTTNNQALTYGANCWPAQKAIAGTACAFATDFTSLLILRFIQGISGPLLGTLNVTLIGNLYEGNQRARAMGYNVSVLSVVFGFAQGINIPSVLTLLTHQYRAVFLSVNWTVLRSGQALGPFSAWIGLRYRRHQRYILGMRSGCFLFCRGGIYYDQGIEGSSYNRLY